jgi:hypothetical protein
MFGLFGGERTPNLLKDTIKAGAIIAVLSVVATQWLSHGLDKQALQRLAADVAIGSDPVATGSLRDTARNVRLDPCTGKPAEKN